MINERFWCKVAVKTEDECWEWTGNRNNKGYGLFRPGGSADKVLSHRFSYEESNGKIPYGMHIMHSCDNPCCVNPKHLSAGTRKDNMVDSAKKGRNGNMKLADASVIALLKDYIAGMLRQDIAGKYGISVLSVSDFTDGRSRAWLHGTHGCPTLQELRDARRLKPNSVLDASRVLEIRSRLAAGEQGKLLAEEYGVHKATISDINLRKIWADI